MVSAIRRAFPPFSLVALFGVLLVSGMFVAASAPDPADTVTSLRPIEIQGAAETTARTGAVRLQPEGALDEILLHAERLVIDHAWQRSARVDTLQTNVVLDRGEESIPLASSTVRFAHFNGRPLVFAVAQHPAQIAVSSSDHLDLMPTSRVNMVKVGMNPDAVAVGAAPDLGYWHTSDRPAVTGTGDGRLSLRGTFSLFVHNVSMMAHGDGGAWSQWTGQREERPGGPATDAELRITVLHVTNGTFEVPNTGSLLFALPMADIQVEGLVALESATGRLVRGDRMVVLDHEPLVLAGAGTIRAEALSAINGGTTGLLITPEPGLEVVTTTGTWTGRSPDGTGFPLDALLGIGATGAVLAAFAVLVESGVVPMMMPSLARGSHTRWMRRARRSAERGRWSLAAWCYRNAVRTNDRNPLSWYDWASAEFEAGRWEKADRIAHRAATVPGIDPADLLELRASSAWLLGNYVACRGFLADLAREQPDMALGLVEDLQIDLKVLGGLVPNLRAARRMEDPPYGYA